jgi:hydrogenase nickel incorporation protein HypA/HybF
MHESAVMKDLLASIHKLIREHQLVQVNLVRIKLGALTLFSEDHFREHFHEAAAGGPIERARLVIETSDDIGAADAQSIVLDTIEGESVE